MSEDYQEAIEALTSFSLAAEEAGVIIGAVLAGPLREMTQIINEWAAYERAVLNLAAVTGRDPDQIAAWLNSYPYGWRAAVHLWFAAEIAQHGVDYLGIGELVADKVAAGIWHPPPAGRYCIIVGVVLSLITVMLCLLT